MFVYCLSVCVCVCVCLHSISAGSLATTKQIPRLLTCAHMCVRVCVCVAYLPLAALFISLFMTILVFMVSLPQLSDCRFYIYVVGWPARALQPHMVSLPYVCVCVCMHVYACL